MPPAIPPPDPAYGAAGASRGEARACVLTCTAVTLLGLAGLATLNVLVDPFGGFGIQLVDADSRTGDSRTARAELLRRTTSPTVLIGSSRTRIGYDGRRVGLSEQPACNIGLDGTNIRELRLVVRRAVENPHVRRIMLSLDLHLFTDGWRPNSDFRCSWFNPERTAFEHRCDLLWNGRTLEASLRALRHNWRGRTGQHDEYGFAVHAGRRFTPTPLETRCRAALEQFLGPPGLLADPEPSPQSWGELQSLISECRQRNVDLTIVIDPVHALLLDGLTECGDGTVYRRWKERLVGLADEADVAVWDFTGFDDYSTEPLLARTGSTPPQWYWEPSHMRRELGDLVLARVFGTSDAATEFGMRLSPEALPQHLERMEVQHRQWRARAAAELAVVAQWLPRRARSRGESPAVRHVEQDGASQLR